MLSLIQQRPRIMCELSRRIGYTNGLHDIFRFARVVTYLHAIAPAPTASLRTAILEREPVRGPKYADGVIDVARALGLIYKSGSNLTLADKGYALHAIQQLNPSRKSARALLLHSVLEFDGEATLNLLDIIANSDAGALLGKLLIDRLLHILELRACWAGQKIESKFVRDMILQELSESKRRLESAVDLNRKQAQSWSAFKEERRLTAEQRLQRFYTHTVNPRRGWLKDLGCIEVRGRYQYHVTKSGHRLLASFREASCYTDSVFVLPFSVEVSELLGVPPSESGKDLFWRATASSFARFSSASSLVS